MNENYIKITELGSYLRSKLLDNPEILAQTETRIIPVATPVDMKLPFITFFRSETLLTPVMTSVGAMSAVYQFQIYTDEHDQGERIAHEVLATLDNLRDERVRLCKLLNWAESHEATVPAFVQILTFDVRPT